MKKIICLMLLLFVIPAFGTVPEGETVRQSFAPNGSTTTYTFTFACNSSDDVLVYAPLTSTGDPTTPLIKDTNYTIAPTGDSYLNGGVVTISPALASTFKVFIVRRIKQSQETSSGAVTASSLIDALDKLTRISHDLEDRKDRSLHLPESDDVTFNMTIPNAVTRAGKTLNFDESGNVGVISGTDIFTVVNGIYDDIIIKSPIIDVRGYGAVGDGVTDDTVAIQAAIDAGIVIRATVFMPGGTYKISDTLFLGRGDGSFDTVSLLGTAATARGRGGTSIDATSFKDRPAINIQGARGVSISNIYIFGANVAPDDLDGKSGVEADYITAGCTFAQFNPYAGISIDAYSGSDPGATGYPGDYEKNLSSGVKIIDVSIKNFVIGITNGPNPSGLQGDIVTMNNVKVDRCAYGIGMHGSQNRGNVIRDCSISNVLTGITTKHFGLQDGAPPMVIDGVWTGLYRLFEVGSLVDRFMMDGLYSESIMSMGIIGIGASAAAKESLFTGCTFKFRPTDDSGDFGPIIQLTTQNPTAFVSCFFQTRAGIFNVNGSQVTYESCTFNPSATWNDEYYLGRDFNNFGPQNMTNCSYFTDLITSTSTINSVSYLPSFASSERLDLTQASRFVMNSENTYKITRSFDRGYIFTGLSNIAWPDDDTVTFTSTTVAELQEGDILFWKTIAQPLLGGGQPTMPSIIISDITGSVVTGTVLFLNTDYDQTWAPSISHVAYREWAPGVTCTGLTTSASDSITGVVGVGCLLEGDFVKGGGIPENTRITDITGTTVTISKNATVTGKTDLWFGEIVLLGDNIRTKTLTITSAEIKALAATPQMLVPAQGDDTVIEFISALIVHEAGTAYVGADTMVIEYATGTDLSAAIAATGFLTVTDDEARLIPSTLALTVDLVAEENSAIQLLNTGGEYATGTGTLTINISYRVHVLGL